MTQRNFKHLSRLGGNLQIFELKQLADMEAAYKRKCLAAFATYKSWCKAQASQTDNIELLYGTLEGTLLRRHAQNTVQAYWIIRRDFRKAFEDYLAKNCCYPSSMQRAA
jgi:hypothetical protein